MNHLSYVAPVDTEIQLFSWLEYLYPLNRSILGPDYRFSLKYILDKTLNHTLHSYPTGYRAFDWEVPKEWTIEAATITSPHGDVLLDFSIQIYT